MLGYAFRDEWAARNKGTLQGFVAASQAAKTRLAGSEQDWVTLAPLVGSDDKAVLSALRAGYAAGIPRRWGEVERRGAMDLYGILAQLGGERLVGRAQNLDPATFSSLVFY
jgi:NitT/TauT family transport system substrate-binding protein